jgi:hypothetical protein
MSCSPFDLRDYFLQELSDPQQQRLVEAHVKTCAPCREELDRLRITGAALHCLAEEEIPQRIAFVSDKIFEPSPWRRRLAAFWNSGARLGFASAAMLSASLVVFALRPVPAPVVNVVRPAATAPAVVTQSTVTQTSVPQTSALSEAEVQQRIQAAVDKAVDLKTKDLVKEARNLQVTMAIAADEFEQEMRRAKGREIANAHFGLPAEDGK